MGRLYTHLDLPFTNPSTNKEPRFTSPEVEMLLFRKDGSPPIVAPINIWVGPGYDALVGNEVPLTKLRRCPLLLREASQRDVARCFPIKCSTRKQSSQRTMHIFYHYTQRIRSMFLFPCSYAYRARLNDGPSFDISIRIPTI